MSPKSRKPRLGDVFENDYGNLVMCVDSSKGWYIFICDSDDEQEHNHGINDQDMRKQYKKLQLVGSLYGSGKIWRKHLETEK